MEESGQWGRSKPANAIGISVGTAYTCTVPSLLASLWHCGISIGSGHSCNAALRWNLDAGPGLRQLVVSAQRDQEWPIVGITLSVASLLLSICWLWTVKHNAWTVLHIGI